LSRRPFTWKISIPCGVGPTSWLVVAVRVLVSPGETENAVAPRPRVNAARGAGAACGRPPAQAAAALEGFAAVEGHGTAPAGRETVAVEAGSAAPGGERPPPRRALGLPPAPGPAAAPPRHDPR